ncbi:acyl carrier protein [Cryobacterium sp. TMS1-20-1]|uniref:acyl carrier protein n=1 Tax=Cryobacterium sp. TMS1-20-1 TaxID=1259223 RepID=UPI00106DA64A|nr:acyl carrier protein [Cryobacterium sp. TMS1-20-1]TFC70142.1 acyl carrier protein [Cryobacterium sp. TMS1-20-1]
MNQFLLFVASIFEVEPSTLSGDTEYNSIPQWDSLMQLRLIGEIEDKYSVEIPIDEIPNLKALSDFYAWLQ